MNLTRLIRRSGSNGNYGNLGTGAAVAVTAAVNSGGADVSIFVAALITKANPGLVTVSYQPEVYGEAVILLTVTLGSGADGGFVTGDLTPEVRFGVEDDFEPVIVDEPALIDNQSSDNNAEPSGCIVSDGSLLIVYASSPSNGEGFGSLYYQIRTSIGTWGSPVLLYTPTSPFTLAGDPTLTPLVDGTILLTWSEYDQLSDIDTCTKAVWCVPLTYSNLSVTEGDQVLIAAMQGGSGSGSTLTSVTIGVTTYDAQITELFPFMAGEGAYALALSANCRGVQLPNGNIVMAISGCLRNNDAVESTVLIQSTDNGLTWAVLGVIVDALEYDPTGRTQFSETALLRVPGGLLVAFIRSDSKGLIYRSTCADNGATWSWPTPCASGGGGGPSVLRFKSGISVMSYRFGTAANANTTAVLVSDDDGMNWLVQQFLTSEFNYGYGEIIATGDESAVLVYAAKSSPTQLYTAAISTPIAYIDGIVTGTTVLTVNVPGLPPSLPQQPAPFVPTTPRTDFVWDGSNSLWSTDHWGRSGVSPKWPGDTGSSVNDTVTIVTAMPPANNAPGITIASFVCRGNSFGQGGIDTQLLTVTGSLVLGTPGGTDSPGWSGNASSVNSALFYGRSRLVYTGQPSYVGNYAVLSDASGYADGPAIFGGPTTINSTAVSGVTFNGDVILAKPCDLSGCAINGDLYCWDAPTGLPGTITGAVIYIDSATRLLPSGAASALFSTGVEKALGSTGVASTTKAPGEANGLWKMGVNIGPASIATPGSSNASALTLTGDGTGQGLDVQGGAGADGIRTRSGQFAGFGICSAGYQGGGRFWGNGDQAPGLSIYSTVGDAHGIQVSGTGAGSGIYTTGYRGLTAIGAAGGSGALIQGNGGGDGLEIAGGTTGRGMHISSGSGGGEGIRIDSTASQGIRIEASDYAIYTNATNGLWINGVQIGSAGQTGYDIGELASTLADEFGKTGAVDGSDWIFSANTLQNAPTGGSAPTVEQIDIQLSGTHGSGAWGPGGPDTTGVVVVTKNPNGDILAGATVYATADVAGKDRISAEFTSNAQGIANCLFRLGQNYVWVVYDNRAAGPVSYLVT